MKQSESIAKLSAALVAAQTDIHNLKPDKEGYGYNYVDLSTILDTVKPVLKKHKLAVTQFPCGDVGNVGVSTVLLHESGEFIQQDFVMPLPQLAKMNAAQAAGAVITYARRYSMAAVLGIASDEDIDAATPKSSQSHEKPPQSHSSAATELKSKIIAKLKSATDEKLFSKEEFTKHFNEIQKMTDEVRLQKSLDNLESAIADRRTKQQEELAVI